MNYADIEKAINAMGEKVYKQRFNQPNLVPRSLVDEAEGEIWQSKKICFF